MNGWALKLVAEERRAAAEFRHEAGVEACGHDGEFWLRGPASAEIEDRLARIPAGEPFQTLPDGALIPWGRRVPRGRLPVGPWRPLAEQMELNLPAIHWPAAAPGAVSLRLTADEQEREPTLLRLDRRTWFAYAATAPQFRLDCWSFALGEGGAALVRGAPLPPLPGVRLVCEAGIACAAGRWWTPPLDARLLAERFGLRGDDVAVLEEDGSWQRVPGEAFVRASRASLAASAAGEAGP